MFTRARHYRTATELVGWRQQARTELRDWGPDSRYVQLTRTAAVAVFDWLDGRTPIGPASGVDREPDDAGISAELIYAEDHERQERRAGNTDRATHLGRVGIVLSWFMHDPHVPSPL